MLRNPYYLILVIVLFANLSCKKFVFENPVDPSQPLTSPSNLQVVSVSELIASLSWNYSAQDYPNISGETFIERSTDGVNFTLVDSTAASTTAKSVAGVYLIGTTYSFRVRAQFSNRVSAYSNTITSSLAFVGPSNLSVTNLTDSSASLRWTGNCPFETGFLIERSTDGINFALVDSVGPSITSKSIAGIYQIGTTYSFRARAKSLYNFSGYSNTATYLLTGVIFSKYSVVFDDNQDGNINPGEVGYLLVYLKNTGTSQANNVNATITSTSSYVSSISPTSSVNFGTIPPSGQLEGDLTYTNMNGGGEGYYTFSFKASNTTPAGTVITFTVTATDAQNNTWTSTFTVPVIQ